MIRNIIYDLCGPIITIDIHRIDRGFQSEGVAVPDSYMTLHRNGVTKLYDAGLISSREFCDRVRQVLDCPRLTDERILFYWNDVITACPQTHLDILRLSHRHYKTFLLSNCDVENARAFSQYLDERAGYALVEQSFDEVCFSSRLKDRKPNPTVFQYILDRHGLQPEETLFIDDCRKHCESASAMGIQARWLKAEEELTDLFDNDGRLI